MSFQEFLVEQEINKKEEENDKIMGAIIEYFSTHDHPEDEEIHELHRRRCGSGIFAPHPEGHHAGGVLRLLPGVFGTRPDHAPATAAVAGSRLPGR